jgi:hypothetical protein
MNTTGIQNYLSNVFRPIVTYDIGTGFIPKLELSNIDTYSGNIVSVFRADVGDSKSNVYVGKESGNLFTNIKNCSNVSAFGYGAGSNISNDSNSVYVGAYAGNGNTSTSSTIAIGANAGAAGAGVSNIFLGTGTRSTLGSSNVFLGHGIDLSSVSSQIRIGFGTNTPIVADMAQGWLGFGGLTTPYDIAYSRIDLSGNTRIQGNVGVNIVPGARTLDVNGNFRAQDASANILDFAGGLTRSSGGFTSAQSNVAVNAAATTIGTLKKGIVMISAVNQSDSADHASRLVLAYTTSNVSDIGSNVAAGDASITFSTSDIQITDTTNTTVYDYSITYFPLP